MNILIIGGAGFLGSNLVRRCLADSGNRVSVIDSLDPRLRSTLDSLKDILPKIEFIHGDMRDLSLMEKAVCGKDVIFNCAGQTSHPLSLADPFFDVELNCKGNLALLEAARRNNKNALIIYTSSSTVIGKSFGKVIDEASPEFPLDIYSANKGVAEKYYYIYNKAYDLNTLSLRFANIYGPYGKGYPEFGFVNYFIALADQDKEIQIYGDGRQSRNIMYAHDAVDLLYECIFHKEVFGNLYFAVHREHYSVIDIAREIISVFGKGRIKQTPWPDIRKRIEIDSVTMSGEKLYECLKWQPKYNLRDGLIKTKEIIEKHKALVNKQTGVKG